MPANEDLDMDTHHPSCILVSDPSEDAHATEDVLGFLIRST